MREKAERRAALTAMAAVSGVGLASGRELVLFFAQMKEAAWVAVLAACGLFGGFVALTVGEGEASARRGGMVALRDALRLLLAALASAYMLTRLGSLGALTLPLRHGYWFGAGFGLLAALAIRWTRSGGALGLLVTLGLSGFYVANALDGRPPRVNLTGATEFSLSGSYPAALCLATLYAALTGCAAAWSLRRVRRDTVRPLNVALRCAALMACALVPGVIALLRGGDRVLVQPMPWVVLSARWGVAGFWLCAGLMAMCATASLSAAAGVVIDALRGKRRLLAASMLAVGVSLFCVLSFGLF